MPVGITSRKGIVEDKEAKSLRNGVISTSQPKKCEYLPMTLTWKVQLAWLLDKSFAVYVMATSPIGKRYGGVKAG